MKARHLIALSVLFACRAALANNDASVSICQRLLGLHAELDRTVRDSNTMRERPFISGWQTYAGADESLAASVLPKMQPTDLLGYRFSSDEPKLTASIQEFHRMRDGREYKPAQVFPSAGASNLVAAFLQSLKRQGIEKVYYFPPLYYLLHDQAQLLGIELVALSNRPISMTENLEDLLRGISKDNARNYLLISDPIWMMGTPVPETTIEVLKQWQLGTGCMIFVDGTFQYMKWDADSPEFSSRLNDDLTIRLICPSKQTGIHGVRFAYLLMPNDPVIRSNIRLSSSNLGGGHSAFDRLAAERMMELLIADGNRPFVDGIEHRHRELVENGTLIEEAGNPSATFFTFARVRNIERYTAMHQGYFGLDGFPDFVRVNLLSEAIEPLHPSQQSNGP